jgi:hypothetical protein
MSRLFISHSSANNAEAVAIRDWLAGEGWNDVFLDPERGITAGERWERALLSRLVALRKWFGGQFPHSTSSATS